MKPAIVLTLLILPTLALSEASVPVSPVIGLDHGVICDVTITGQEDAPLTESGQLNLIDQTRQIDVTTAQVPTRLGLSFGIRVALEQGATLRGARVVVHHPPMGRARVTTQSWPVVLSDGGSALNLFTFEHDYEMVQGRWSFQIVADEGIAFVQAFDVLGPFAVPQVQDACFPAQILS